MWLTRYANNNNDCTLVGCPGNAQQYNVNYTNGASCGPYTANRICGNVSTNCNWCGCYDDIGFIRDVTQDVMNRMCIDRSRVYMAGMSQGGMFTSWLSSQLTDIFAGFAPVRRWPSSSHAV
jgi:poly(3-hydroxybutyrate) depolymerase